MAYVKVTNFAVKDGLPSGNPSKIVKGAEIDVEFNALQAESTSITSALAGKQPVDATLTSLSALGTVADKLAYTTATDTWAETSITAAARSILDDATVADMRVTIGAAASGANTDITSLSAPALGSATATTQTVGDNSTKVATTAFVASNTNIDKIQAITATQGSGALTLGLNPTTLDFRSTTLATGVPNTLSVGSAISLVVPSGATLGAVTTVSARLIIVAIDNAGTVELAVVNIAGGNDLSETGLISTTAIDTASDSANVFYSTAARSNVPYRVVGAIDTVNTAGAWGNPTLVQGYGGQALAAMSSLGYGQTWQTVTRNAGTTYYNTTGKPICLIINAGPTSAASAWSVSISINGAAAFIILYSGGATYVNPGVNSSTVVIPVGASYVLTNVNIGAGTVTELR